MSLDALRWACDARKLETGARLVLYALADYADRFTLECWPTVGEVADHANLGDSTVRRHLVDLERAGLVVKVRRIRHRDGSLGAWVYRLEVPEPYRSPASAGGRKGPGDHRSPVSARPTGGGALALAGSRETPGDEIPSARRRARVTSHLENQFARSPVSARPDRYGVARAPGHAPGCDGWRTVADADGAPTVAPCPGDCAQEGLG